VNISKGEKAAKMKNANPVYLLAGGPGMKRTDPDPLLQKIFAATGKSAPSIAYIGSACNDDRGFFGMLKGYFALSGAGKVILVPTVHAFNKKSFEKGCAEADLVFLSGGDVEEGMNILAKRSLAKPLAEMFNDGKMFFGLSAGSIMLAKTWVRWKNESDESSELFNCLGFAPVLCDTHGEEDKWDELKAAIKLSPDKTIGYGIRTASGLMVLPNGKIEKMGLVDTFIKKGNTVSSIDL
jgi:peptidase E